MSIVMADRISGAIKLVDEAIALHRAGAKAPLSPKLLENVRLDLIRMLQTVQERDYLPGYSRFVLDWPGDEEFVKVLVNLAYDYKRKVV